MHPQDPENPDFHEENFASEGFTEWKRWKERPSDDSYLEVIYRDGLRGYGYTDEFDWDIDLHPGDIAWFRPLDSEGTEEEMEE